MRAYIALIKREFLEHRGAFVYVPAILLIVLSAIILIASASGNASFSLPPIPLPGPAAIYQAAIGGAFLLWSVYLLVGLFFYYADSFSADRHNNALLFWKSMPQSDFKVLSSKAVSGITIFLALIAAFALATGVPLSGFPVEIYLLCLAMALLPQILGHGSFNYAIKFFPAAYLGLLSLLEPIGASLLALVLFAEMPGMMAIVGMVLILFAVGMTVVFGEREGPATD